MYYDDTLPGHNEIKGLTNKHNIILYTFSHGG